MRRADKVEIAFLTAVWAGTVALIDPRGDFPLHDDWDFAIATWNFARTGHFHFTQFTAVALRAQVLWGALWTHLFGQSFEVLRASTLLLSLLTVLLVDRILARAGAARGVRMLASLALLFHPLFLWASCTYMTDVPFVFAAAVAFYCFVRALQECGTGSPTRPGGRVENPPHMSWLIAGCCAVLGACFIRQNGAYLLGAPLLIAVMQRRRRFAAVIAAFIALFGVLLFARPEWFSGAPKMFAVHYHMWQESSFRLREQIATLDHYVVFNAQNCALFFLPLTVALLWAAPRSRIVLAIVAAIVGFRVIDLARAGYLVPYASRHLYSDILPGNLFIDFGVGPPNLFDTFSLGMPYPFNLGTFDRALLTALSAVLAIVLVAALLRKSENIVARLAILTAAIGTLALFASGLYYDRYSLDSAWAVVIALPLLAPWQKRAARAAAVIALVIIAVFSTLAVQEYFRWQRARWTAFQALRAQGIAVTQIDGGSLTIGRSIVVGAASTKLRSRAGYRVIGTFPFRSFLGTRHGAIYALSETSD